MGQVYQATDTKLNRQVALKILPEAFATDPERLARFEREAHVLASLNHPGIAAIYGIEEEDDTRALVLELVEGPTLADRISQGPVPVDEALPLAKQIAEALEAAHEAGVIHRDLKPANIKVRKDGTVKVLDFGLAKALDTAPEGDPSQSPTLTAAATQMGVIMGTAAYMSPEQAAGKAVDKRSDIWSFGVVLFEMLTGQRLFTGETVSHVLARVLERPLDFTELPSPTPSSVRRVLRRCLERDTKRQLRDLNEALVHFEEAAAVSDDRQRETAPTRRPASWRHKLPLAIGSLVLGGLITVLAMWSLPSADPPAVVRFPMAPDGAATFHVGSTSPDIAISPDGQYLAYLTGGTVGLRADELRVHPLDRLVSDVVVAEGDLNHPFFSADGASIGFYDRGGGTNPMMRRVSVRGGPATTITNLPGFLRGASWGADDTIVFAASDPETGLWRVPAVGGDAEQLTTPDTERGEVDHRWPEFLPGQQAVLFTIIANPLEDSEVAVLSLETGEQKVVLRGGSFPQYTPTGHLLYGVQGNLWAIGFDQDGLETVGDPVPILQGVQAKASGLTNFGVSENGSLVYMPVLEETADARTLVWVDRQGREEPLGAPPAPYESPRLRYLALHVEDPDDTDVVVYDLRRDTRIRLTFDPGVDRTPLWRPDGQRVVFSSSREDGLNLYWKAADGTGQAERLNANDAFVFPQSWSADGETLVVGVFSSGNANLGLLQLDGEQRIEGLIETEYNEVYAEVSPDGRWIAYTSDESGQFEVYVRPFPKRGRRQMADFPRRRHLACVGTYGTRVVLQRSRRREHERRRCRTRTHLQPREPRGRVRTRSPIPQENSGSPTNVGSGR